MTERRRRKCLNCRRLFRPDPRNVRHQRYCSAGPCRKASKAASPTRWLPKSQSRNYLQGPKKGYNFKPVDLMQFHAVDSSRPNACGVSRLAALAAARGRGSRGLHCRAGGVGV